MMRTGLILPTRYHSSRLPGKVLRLINGIPNLQRMVTKALKSPFIDKVILALSEDDADEIMDFYSKYLQSIKGVEVYIGPHNDLLQRTNDAAEFYGIDLIVDTSHCCAMMDPSMIGSLIKQLKWYNADYSSNCITRSYPDGYDLQVYTKKIYERVNALVPKNHVTREWTGWNIWHWREKLSPKPIIVNQQALPSEFYPHWRLTLDTENDFEIIREIQTFFDNVGKMAPSHIEVIGFIKDHPQLLEKILANNTVATELAQEDK